MRQKIFYKISFLAVILAAFALAPYAGAETLQVNTNPATNIYSNQATLNGYVSQSYQGGYNPTIFMWFQWGTSSSYGNETTHQVLVNYGSFSHQIYNLAPNTTYHFRAVAQLSNGSTFYGQNQTFYTSGPGSGTGNLLVSKKVINLTSGNLNWQTSVNARPSDVLSFAVTIQATDGNVNDIFVRDIFPENLIYAGNLTVNASLNYSGDPMTGLNVGSLNAGEVYVIAYQARLASAQSFSYGTTILNNGVMVTSYGGEQKAANAQILVSNSFVSGATYIPTGISAGPITQSPILPIALIILGLWLYFSGKIQKFADWVLKLRHKT